MRLTRVTNKVFGSTASIVDDPTYGPQIGQFGSAKAGTYNATADVATIQGLPAWNNGWIDAVIPNQQYPTLPEMTGFGKVVTHQTGYILQEGIPEWDSGTTYYKNSIVKHASITSIQSATASIGDSTGITSASVNSNTFISQISTDGVYVFSYDGANWLYNGISTSLNIYGITYEGTAVNGDEITITLSTETTLNDALLYISLTDENINNNPTSGVIHWKPFINEVNNNTRFAINNGDINLLINNSNKIEFNIDNSNPLTYTSVNGSTRVVNALNDIDVSTVADGTYKIVLPATGNQPSLSNGKIYNQIDIPINATLMGNLNLFNGIVSGFATGASAIKSKYLLISGLPTSYSTIDFIVKYNMSGDINTLQNIFAYGGDKNKSIAINLNSGKLALFVSSNGSTWDVVNDTQSTLTVSANTNYYIRVQFTGTQYLVDLSTTGEFDSEEINYITVNSTTSPYKADFLDLGLFCQVSGTTINNFLGSINIIESTIKTDNNLVWQGKGNNDDIWLNPLEPYTVKQYDGSNWNNYNDVILLDSSVTVASGAITALEQPRYNNSHMIPNKYYISGLGMPSHRYDEITPGATESTYVAPANGYFTLVANAAGNGFCSAGLENLQNYLSSYFAINTLVGYPLNAFLPAKKGDVISLYHLNVNIRQFRFIYAEGENEHVYS